MAATNKDIEALIQQRRFREDAAARAREDIPFLVDHFLAKYGESLGERRLASETLDRLTAWGQRQLYDRHRLGYPVLSGAAAAHRSRTGEDGNAPRERRALDTARFEESG